MPVIESVCSTSTSMLYQWPRHLHFLARVASGTSSTCYIWVIPTHVLTLRGLCVLVTLVSSAKMVELICGEVYSRGLKETCVKSVRSGFHTGAIWQIRLKDPGSAAMRAVAIM